MTRVFKKRILIFAAIISLLVAISIFGWCWLKSPYNFPTQRQLATEFLQLINQGNLEKAYEMTSKSEYSGKTFEEFKARTQREIRGSNYTYAYSHPPQTNGNRLRRYINGSEVDMKKVHIQLTGASLLLIAFELNSNGRWTIYKFYSHAG